VNRRLVGALGPPVVATLFHTLGASYRYQVLHPDRLAALVASGPVVLTLWHDQAFAAARFLHRRLHRAGLGLTVIASQSRDGELVARLAARLGVPVVRGSTSRGGRGAILALYRSLAKHRSSPLLVPDGPRGPRHVAKSGAVLLAQFGSAPLVPLGFAAEHGVTLRSWDRMTVPRPWSRVAVAIGEPRQVSRQLDPGELEAERTGLEAALDALDAEARAAFAPRPASSVAAARAARPEPSVAGRAAEGMHEKKPV
jgi:lysophospholipid acyltransferase (LPLAT)-like uncharacterized protein